MALEYTITVNELKGAPEHDGKANVIFGVEYNLQGVDGEYEYIVTGYTALEYDSNNFIDFENLTEDNVKDWIVAEKNGYEAYQNIIVNAIAELKAPKDKSLTKPW